MIRSSGNWTLLIAIYSGDIIIKLYRSHKLVPVVEQLIVLPDTEIGLVHLLRCKRIKQPEAGFVE
ncbi:hypothetical protein ASE99_24115 [Serratia sp. Leaf51]|nr:hypothetical protein ASE99_24115 [Serratia sp. Leaf51]